MSRKKWKREPRGDQAARAVALEGLTFTQAGDRLGITPDAVRHAWQRLFPGQDPPRKYGRRQVPRGDQAARAVALGGLTFAQAGDQLGVTPEAVSHAWRLCTDMRSRTLGCTKIAGACTIINL